MTFRHVMFAALAAFSLGLGAASARDGYPEPCPKEPRCVQRCVALRDACGAGHQCVRQFLSCVNSCPQQCYPPVLE